MAPDPGRPAFAELTVAHKMLGEGRWQDAQRELQAQLAGPLAQAPIEIALMARSMLGRAYHVQGNQAVAARLYQQVIEAWAKGQGELRGLPPEQEVARLAPALGAVGEALFFQAEQKRAAADALVLNVPRRELGRDAVDRFLRTIVLPYMRAKRSAIEAAERAYTAIAELQPMPPPWWLIAAASRVGELWDAFHAELTALPHPAEWDQAGDSPHVVDGRPLAWAEMRAAYASSLTQATAPFLARARSAYELCARHAERYGVSGEYADHCTAWLDQHAAPLP